MPMGTVTGGSGFALDVDVVYNDGRPAPQELYGTPSSTVSGGTCTTTETYNDWYGVGGWLSIDEYVTDEGILWKNLNDAAASNPRGVLDGQGRRDVNLNGTVGFTLHTPYYDQTYDDPEVLSIDDGNGQGPQPTPVFASVPFDGKFLRVVQDCLSPNYPNGGDRVPTCYEIFSYPGGPWKVYAYAMAAHQVDRASGIDCSNPRLVGSSFVNGVGNNPAMLLSSVTARFAVDITSPFNRKGIHITRFSAPPSKLWSIATDLGNTQSSSVYAIALKPQYGSEAGTGYNYFNTNIYPPPVRKQGGNGPPEQFSVLFQPGSPVEYYNRPGIVVSSTAANGRANGERTQFTWTDSNQLAEETTSFYGQSGSPDEIDDDVYARPNGTVASLTSKVSVADNPVIGPPGPPFPASTDVTGFLSCLQGAVPGPPATAGGSAVTTSGTLITLPRSQQIQYLYEVPNTGDVNINPETQLVAFTDPTGATEVTNYILPSGPAPGIGEVQRVANVPLTQWSAFASGVGKQVKYQYVGSGTALTAFPPGTFTTVTQSNPAGTASMGTALGIPLLDVVQRMPDGLVAFTTDESYDIATLEAETTTDENQHTTTFTYDALGNVTTMAGNGIVTHYDRGPSSAGVGGSMDLSVYTTINGAKSDTTVMTFDAYGFLLRKSEPNGTWTVGATSVKPSPSALTTAIAYATTGVPMSRTKTLAGTVVESMSLTVDPNVKGISAMSITDSTNAPVFATQNVPLNFDGNLQGATTAQIGAGGGKVPFSKSVLASGRANGPQSLGGNSVSEGQVPGSVGQPSVSFLPARNGNTFETTTVETPATPMTPTKCIGAP
jgi:YD repeat-containing protein